MPLSLCDVSVLLHGIITSNTAEAFFLYFCCKAIREQTEVAYDLIGPTQYQRRKRYRILNFKSHTTHYPFFHGQTTQNLSTKWVPKSSSWKVFGIKHPQTLQLLNRRGPRCPDMRLSQHYIGPKNDILSFFNFLQKKVSFLFQKLFKGYIFCFLGNSFGWCQISFFFRDNGIVISISIAQWLFEYVNILFFHLYMHKYHGFDTLADKCFDLYNIFTMMVIAPCFYLRGDETFRRNWANLGPKQTIEITFF